MDWRRDSDFIFNADRAKYRRGIYRVPAVVPVGRTDRPLGLFWQASRDHASAGILCHSRADWHVSLVLMGKNQA